MALAASARSYMAMFSSVCDAEIEFLVFLGHDVVLIACLRFLVYFVTVTRSGVEWQRE